MTSAYVPPVLAGGRGSLVTTGEGRELLDVAMGFGAAFLGHAHPRVTDSLQREAAQAWSSGRFPTRDRARVEGLVGALLPPGLRLGGLCTTGMEVAEFALRVAATHTGRTEFAGFARSMHGKSAMTAALCWANAAIRPGHVHTLPFVADANEAAILESLERLLAARTVAALLVEPIQGSNSAREASIGFYDRVVALCREHGTLCVFDEILTGLHRTGPRFYCDRLASPPDILLFAKCVGNGFPVTAIAVRGDIAIQPAAAPGSTFSGNPLAIAAVEGTLAAMAELDMPRLVERIEPTVRKELASLEGRATLRGRGALWCVELAAGADMDAVAARILARGVLATTAGRCVRLLPAATMPLEMLADACARIAQSVD